MTTVSELVNQAFKDLKVTGESETPSAEQMADGMKMLAQMLAIWQTSGTYLYAHREIALSPNGSAVYTVGPSGFVITAKPVFVEKVTWRSGGTDYQLSEMTVDEYTRIPVKSIIGMPFKWNYESGPVNGTLTLYPQPASGEVRLLAKVALPVYDNSFADIALPAEVELALRFSLAELLAVQYSAQDMFISQTAANLRRAMKRGNLVIGSLSADVGTRFNIMGNTP